MSALHTQRGRWSVQVRHDSRGEYEISLNLSDDARAAGQRSWGQFTQNVERVILYGSGLGKNTAAANRRDEAFANALLMAEAPEMLSLLRELADVRCSESPAGCVLERRLDDRAIALLARIDHPPAITDTAIVVSTVWESAP